MLLFCSCIFIPFLLGIIEEDKNISEVEKRNLSAFPELHVTLQSIKNFPHLFNTYYADHFGLRDILVRAYKNCKFFLGDSPSEDVTIGKDGWYFLGSIKKGYQGYYDPIGDVRNINLFSEKDLENFALHITTIQEWLQNKGITYIFVIAPNKHTVYFDKLPRYITRLQERSATDQLVTYLRKHTDILLIDLREDLIKNKNKKQLYYKTDTHWNYNAANIVQYSIMSTIENIFPGKIYPESFEIADGDLWKGGDLINFIGVHYDGEIFPYPVFKDQCMPQRHPEDMNIIRNYSYTCDGQQLSIVAYHDSFFNALVPFFSRKFKRSTYISERISYQSLNEQLKKETPDIVLEEWVERTLPYTPSLNEFVFPYNKAIFNESKKIIFQDMLTALKFSAVVKGHAMHPNGYLAVRYEKETPCMIFPSLSIKKDHTYMIHIKLSSSIHSSLSLKFNEEQFTKVTIHAGSNDIYLMCKSSDFTTQPVTEPITTEFGDLAVQNIEIREL